MSWINIFKPRTINKGLTSGVIAYRSTRNKGRTRPQNKGLVTRELYLSSPTKPSYQKSVEYERRSVFELGMASIRKTKKPSIQPKWRSGIIIPQLYYPIFKERPNTKVQPLDQGLICTRRQERKEVMHALGHAGKSGQRPKKWTQQSKFQCERIY